MSDEHIADEIMQKAQQARRTARYMSSTQELVERQILKAQEEGKFDNLPGMGQPLNLEENPFEPLELRMVFKILKENGYAPYWIELGKEIDTDFSQIKSEVATFKKYVRIFNREKHKSGAIHQFNQSCSRFYRERRLHLEKISGKIMDYNLHCPVFSAMRANITIDEEMYKIITEIEAEINRK